MARPSPTEQRELEQLETLAGTCALLANTTDVLRRRMRQVRRRALGDENLLAVVRPAATQVSEIAELAADMHEQLSIILDNKQCERQEHNRKQPVPGGNHD